MMRAIACLAISGALAGCGKIGDSVETSLTGYALRCIEGTRYVLLSSESGLAIAPLLKPDGLPAACSSREDAGNAR